MNIYKKSQGNWINELRCLKASIWFSEGRGQEFESLRVRHFLVSMRFKVERRFSIIHFLWLKLLRTEFERIEVLTSRYLEKQGRRTFSRDFLMEKQLGKNIFMNHESCLTLNVCFVTTPKAGNSHFEKPKLSDYV